MWTDKLNKFSHNKINVMQLSKSHPAPRCEETHERRLPFFSNFSPQLLFFSVFMKARKCEAKCAISQTSGLGLQREVACLLLAWAHLNHKQIFFINSSTTLLCPGPYMGRAILRWGINQEVTLEVLPSFSLCCKMESSTYQKYDCRPWHI